MCGCWAIFQNIIGLTVSHEGCQNCNFNILISISVHIIAIIMFYSDNIRCLGTFTKYIWVCEYSRTGLHKPQLDLNLKCKLFSCILFSNFKSQLSFKWHLNLIKVCATQSRNQPKLKTLVFHMIVIISRTVRLLGKRYIWEFSRNWTTLNIVLVQQLYDNCVHFQYTIVLRIL